MDREKKYWSNIAYQIDKLNDFGMAEYNRNAELFTYDMVANPGVEDAVMSLRDSIIDSTPSNVRQLLTREQQYSTHHRLLE